MRDQLFTEDYLSHADGGITETAAWRDLGASDLAATEARLAEIFQTLPVTGAPAEAVTGFDLKRHYLLAERGPG